MSEGDIKIVFLDGRFHSDSSSLNELSEHIAIEGDAFTLRLPKNFSEKRPIHLQHINRSSKSTRLKQTIIAEENSESTIIESFESSDDYEYDHQIEIKIDLKSNARLHYYKNQQEGKKAHHNAQLIAELTNNSYLATYHVVMGAQTSNDRFSYRLLGEGSTCESIGFYQSDAKQAFQIDSHIHHLSSHSNSRQVYKGIANGQSHAIFNGMIMVDPNINEVCAHQKNDNLLLSQQAQVDTKPELEIYSEDVRCSHGATIGQLDEDVLFYLRSRGIDEGEARALLTEGFANEIFNAFPDSSIVSMIRGGSHE